MSSKRDKDLAAKLMGGCGALDIDERPNKERLFCVPSPSAMEKKTRREHGSRCVKESATSPSDLCKQKDFMPCTKDHRFGSELVRLG